MNTLLARARAAHTRLLGDLCVITGSGGEGVFDPDTGDYTTTTSTIYSGACRVKGPTAGNVQIREVEAGDAEQVANRHTLVLPHGTAPDVGVGATVTMTGGPLTGAVYTVVGVNDASTMTARSLLVERVASRG